MFMTIRIFLEHKVSLYADDPSTDASKFWIGFSGYVHAVYLGIFTLQVNLLACITSAKPIGQRVKITNLVVISQSS